MKTKEDVVRHFEEYGYSKDALNRILGFLVGAGIKEFDEEMLIQFGNGTWADFYEWWNSEDEECDDCCLCGLIEYLVEQHNTCNDEKKKDEISGYIEFLINTLG